MRLVLIGVCFVACMELQAEVVCEDIPQKLKRRRCIAARDKTKSQEPSYNQSPNVQTKPKQHKSLQPVTPDVAAKPSLGRDVSERVAAARKEQQEQTQKLNLERSRVEEQVKREAQAQSVLAFYDHDHEMRKKRHEEAQAYKELNSDLNTHEEGRIQKTSAQRSEGAAAHAVQKDVSAREGGVLDQVRTLGSNAVISDWVQQSYAGNSAIQTEMSSEMALVANGEDMGTQMDVWTNTGVGVTQETE